MMSVPTASPDQTHPSPPVCRLEELRKPSVQSPMSWFFGMLPALLPAVLVCRNEASLRYLSSFVSGRKSRGRGEKLWLGILHGKRRGTRLSHLVGLCSLWSWRCVGMHLGEISSCGGGDSAVYMTAIYIWLFEIGASVSCDVQTGTVSMVRGEYR